MSWFPRACIRLRFSTIHCFLFLPPRQTLNFLLDFYSTCCLTSFSVHTFSSVLLRFSILDLVSCFNRFSFFELCYYSFIVRSFMSHWFIFRLSRDFLSLSRVLKRSWLVPKSYFSLNRLGIASQLSFRGCLAPALGSRKSYISLCDGLPSDDLGLSFTSMEEKRLYWIGDLLFRLTISFIEITGFSIEGCSFDRVALSLLNWTDLKLVFRAV